MLKVLFDHQKFSEQKYGGITRYFANLIIGLKSEPECEVQLGAVYSENHYIHGEQLKLNNVIGRALLTGNAKKIYKWNKQYSKYLIKKEEFDVFHPTYFNPYFLKIITKPYILTIHDMIYERLPDYFPLNDQLPNWKKQTIPSAAALIAISGSTKRDLMEIMNVPEEKITVIHHGIDLDTPLETESIVNLPARYLLFVGERSNYKNFFRYITCCAQLAKQYPDLHFVFAGGGDFRILDSDFINRLNLQDRTLQFNVNDAQLNYLYQNAVAFVFPSLYEGFGLPILEAFKAGCPVVTGNTSCFPEIGGDAVCYFDPLDPNNMVSAIKPLLDDAGFRNAQIEKGNARVKLFPLLKQISETLKLYQKVANS